MNLRSRICVIGSANVDLTFRTPRFPRAGETLTGKSLHECMGGKGANQAVAAARLGADVTFIACVGDDTFGAQAVRQYKEDGICTDYVRHIDGHPTGTAAIIVDDLAENCIIVISRRTLCFACPRTSLKWPKLAIANYCFDYELLGSRPSFCLN